MRSCSLSSVTMFPRPGYADMIPDNTPMQVPRTPCDGRCWCAANTPTRVQPVVIKQLGMCGRRQRTPRHCGGPTTLTLRMLLLLFFLLLLLLLCVGLSLNRSSVAADFAFCQGHLEWCQRRTSLPVEVRCPPPPPLSPPILCRPFDCCEQIAQPAGW